MTGPASPVSSGSGTSSGRLVDAPVPASWERRSQAASPPGPDRTSAASASSDPRSRASVSGESGARAGQVQPPHRHPHARLSRPAGPLSFPPGPPSFAQRPPSWPTEPPWWPCAARNTSVSRSSAAGSTCPVTTGATVASQEAAPASGPGSQPCPRAAAAARHAASTSDAPGRLRSWARVMCTCTWVGCPARPGTILAAISRRHASSSASWWRWVTVRRVFRPGRLAQRLQHRTHCGRAAGGQVTGEPGRPAEGQVQQQPPVVKPVIIAVGTVLAAALIHELRQPHQICQLRPVGGRPGQDLVGVLTHVRGQPVAPPADRPRPRRRDLPLG